MTTIPLFYYEGKCYFTSYSGYEAPDKCGSIQLFNEG